MVWDHKAKQVEIALAAINRPRPFRAIKVVPHDPLRDPRLTTEVGGWIGKEHFILGKTPEEMEPILGFECNYLAHGVDIFEFTRPIAAGDFDIGGAYTHLPGGMPWDGIDRKWPPGSGAPQWRLKHKLPCRLIGTYARGVPFR